MSWHFSRELVAGCMAANCLDGAAAVQWKLTPMPDMCSSHVRMMELFPFSRFGMMCVHLTVELGEELLTWFLAGFRARMCLSQDRVEGLSTASEAVCGGSMRESLPRCGRGMSLPKTARCWSVEDCISCCETLPGSGMMLRGVCYRHEIAELHTCGKECGCLLPPPPVIQNQYLTPIATDGRRSLLPARHLWTHWQGHPGSNLAEQVASQAVELYGPEAPGFLNPSFVEWLMGWPIGSTGLDALEMDKFRLWLQLHSVSLNEFLKER